MTPSPTASASRTEAPDAARLAAMLGKVRALLTKAEADGVTEPEAEALNAKAAELIARYGIDAAMLAEADPSADVVGDRQLEITAPYSLDKLQLLTAVADPLRVRVISRRTWTGRAYVHTARLFGYGADLDRVELLYTSLLLQSAQGMLRSRPLPGENVKAFRRSWLHGFSVAVYRRLTAAEQDAQNRANRPASSSGATSARSVDLVLADRRALVNRVVEAEYPNLQNAGRRRLSGSGQQHGYGAGMGANLGTTSSDLAASSDRHQLDGSHR
jgi:hypothetical protein